MLRSLITSVAMLALLGGPRWAWADENTGKQLPLTSAPYVLSPGWSTPYYGAYYGNQSPTVATVQGLASLTSTTGQYYMDVQSARISREISRQMSLDTQRKQLELKLELERLRPTAPKILAAQKKNELNWARKYASTTQVWSGSTLNALLESVIASPNPSSGPKITLSEDTLKGLNLTDRTTRANLSLLKDEGKIEWTETLSSEAYDTVRDRFNMSFSKAAEYVIAGKALDRRALRDLSADLESLEVQLDDQVVSLAPSRYIESRRLLNKLKDTIKGFSDPRLCKSYHNDWRKNVSTVSDLVDYCKKNGLQFGPAATGSDYAAYTAAYHAIRSYERELQP